DSSWHKARSAQGYYNVDPAKLVMLFAGKPYVDMRNSFNSFFPSDFSKSIKQKLMSFYFDKISRCPELQDKVEFEVVFTCYDLYMDERCQELLDSGFSDHEIDILKKSFLKFTNSLVCNSGPEIESDLNSLKSLDQFRQNIQKLDPRKLTVNELILNAKKLLDNCKQFGTIQFSKLARLAFIGKIILKSLVNKKVIDENFYHSFMGSIETIATEITKDFQKVAIGKLSNVEFIKKYYHLRPGSYDITTPRYESNPDIIGSMLGSNVGDHHKAFVCDDENETRIDFALSESKLNFTARDLLKFARTSLESRELAKFEFSKNLSDALEFLAMAGNRMGFTRCEVALLDINDIFVNNLPEQEKVCQIWRKKIEAGLREKEINKHIILPPIIFSETDFDIIRYYQPKPNFITQKSVTGTVVDLTANHCVSDLKNKIVLLENGDPGFDWIFTRNIAGLITKYGGVASHMSIRCAEFGIPAAIGCGTLFDSLLSASQIQLDCKFNKIIPMRYL
ncbi:hypothetical protein COV93_06945, partial [Candidatus Woesearchaeota archaeon CG11_big_fil_rev_8_21_14_0_20_43_8]